MGSDQFIGTWKLVTSEFRRADGTIIYPYGQDALGVLTYDAAGNMTVQLLRADRPAFVSGDLYNATPEEIKAAFEGAFAYFGRYDVNGAAGTVTHHVIGCTFPNWIGGDQTRFFAFSDQWLTLSTPPILAAGSTMTGVLIWERIA
jgi:Lipocalin-like domain